MANKQVNELVELTSLASDDLLIAYDTSEPGTEKVKKISTTNAFAGYATDAELNAISGTLQSHTHDGRYYTETETDAVISGAINTNVNNMFSYNAGTHEITFKGHLIPDGNDVWNIGAADKKIAELYVSATTIHIGDTATFSGTSLAITGGVSPTGLSQTPTVQASSLVLQPFVYNPGAGNITVNPKLEFINTSGQQYGISFNVSDNDFSFDSPAGAAKGNIKTNKLTADTIETTGNTQILFKQAVRTDNNVILGYDENNTVTIKGVVDLRTPITFGQAATLGDGNDTIAVNCGISNKFTVNSQYFGINTGGAITASGITTTGNSEIGGNLNVTGNLSVQGDNFVVNTQTVLAEDNLIVINSNETGAGVTAGVAGIDVERGSSTNYQFYFDESQDNFRVGISGSLQAVATREDTPTSGGVATWNASQYRFDTQAVNTAFNKNYGTTSGTIAQGNDSRFTDARTPTSHGNTYHAAAYITAAGVTYEQLNSNGDIGTTASTLCAGDDGRLVNARTPTSHGNSYHSSVYIVAADVTYSNLNSNGSVGTGSTQVARGDHTHAGGGTATTFSTTRTDYKGVTDGAVAGQLMWKNYANGHTIFDASASTSPTGAAIGNTNPDSPWTATYPTLMGYNGANTYGVRVDSARTADSTNAVAGLAVHAGRNNEANKVVRTDGNGYLQTGYINSSNGDENGATPPARVWGTNGSDSYMRSYNVPRSMAGSGYCRLVAGLYIVWGTTPSATSQVPVWVGFPMAFPTACLHVSVMAAQFQAIGMANTTVVTYTTGFTMTTGQPPTQTFTYMAIGY